MLPTLGDGLLGYEFDGTTLRITEQSGYGRKLITISVEEMRELHEKLDGLLWDIDSADRQTRKRSVG